MTLPRSVTMAGLFLLLVGAMIACDDSPVDSGNDISANPNTDGDAFASAATEIPFEDAEVFFEFNTTDDDLGLQVFLDAEGWTKVDVTDPDNNKLFQVLTQGPLSELGITELRFESAEPSPAEVLALFPPGEYTFRGKTYDGARLTGDGELSHDFLPAFDFSPADGAVVDPNDVTVTWNAPGAELVQVILENEENDNVFDVIVEDASGSLDIPPQFLEAGIEYKIELLAYSENGNRTIVESFFVTAS